MLIRDGRMRRRVISRVNVDCWNAQRLRSAVGGSWFEFMSACGETRRRARVGLFRGCALVVVALAVLVSTRPVRAQRAPVEAEHGMVASAHALASEAGVEILKRGGNAVDAAVATGLALAVTYPWAGNLGGGGFMLIHLADDPLEGGGRTVVIDYRETAPAAATRDMYVGADGEVMEGLSSSTLGWRASGVPGTVAGFALALEKYGSGRISWAEAVEPARRLAAEGHHITPGAIARLRLGGEHLNRFEASRRIYLKNGEPWRAGERWVQPELAATLGRLQREGPREFYEGETAVRIAAAMTENGGTITGEDLKGYRAVEREPLRGTYRGREVVTMPPPSSGGIALLQMLAMIEPFDVGAMGLNAAAKLHLFAEAMRRAFRDRAEYLGDPDQVTVPVAGLLDRGYLASRMKDFDAEKATASATLAAGIPAGRPTGGGSSESTETTHYSVVDSDGNAVSNTYTLNGAYGSGVTIPGTGVLMNNEMDDFTSKPGVPNAYGLIQGEANAIAPLKRPLSSMTPTIVFKDGRVMLVTGSPGGPTIINTVFQVITNMIDHGMPVMQAVEAPRIHHQWMPDTITYERYGLSEDTIVALAARGQAVKPRVSYEGGYQGDAETIAIDPVSGRRLGAADPRNMEARAVGY